MGKILKFEKKINIYIVKVCINGDNELIAFPIDWLISPELMKMDYYDPLRTLENIEADHNGELTFQTMGIKKAYPSQENLTLIEDMDVFFKYITKLENEIK